MSIRQDLQKDAVPAFIELYKVDLNPCGVAEIFFLSPHSRNGDPISFDGQEYTPFPITGEGWEQSFDGAPPQPTLRVSNVTKFLQTYLTDYDDLVGALVTRVLTLESYLDDGATPNGSQVFGEQVYVIEQLTGQNKVELTFLLSSLLDSKRIKLPRGQVLRAEFPGAGLFRRY